MEGVEGPHSRPVRILRHRFEPSDYLIEHVSHLLERQTREKKLRFFATKLAVLDSANYYNFRYDDSITKLGESFEHRTTPVVLNGKIGFQTLPEQQIRIGFQPSDQKRFNDLVSGFNILDNLRPDEISTDGKKINHYIYTDVARSALLNDDNERRFAIKSFKNTLAYGPTKRLYTFRPLEISGYDHVIPFKYEDEEIARIGRPRLPWQDQGIAS